MEQPTKETTVKSGVQINDQNPKPPHSADLKPLDHWIADESTLQVKIETKGDQAPTRTAFGSKKSVHWNLELVLESPAPDQKVVLSSSAMGSNPYIARALAEIWDASLKGVLGRWRRKVGEAAMKAESLTGNMWQHRVVSLQ